MNTQHLAAALYFVLAVACAKSLCGAERTVLLEKLSVTWCPHCMAAAQALDDLVDDYGDRFIPLEVFSSTASGGRYPIPWGQSRTFDFYNLASYPTAWFDGVTSRAGSTNAYNSYLSGVNSRLAAATDVLVYVAVKRTDERTYDVTATVGLETGGAAKTVRVYLVEALDFFGVYDDAATVPRNTLKQVLETGFDVELTPGQTQSITRSITFDDSSWNEFEDIRLIAWAQSPAASGPAEVYNAAQFSLSETLAGDFDGNGMVNGDDFAIWKIAFGTNKSADSNDDGISNGNDFLAWQQTLGNSGPTIVATSTPIPEPMSFVLFVAASFGVLGANRRRSVRLVVKAQQPAQ